MMRRLAHQRLRLIVLALAIVGSFAVRAFVNANWEGHSLPFGLSGSSFYGTTTLFDPVARVHRAWAVGVDGGGHPLILQNNGVDWSVAYNETRLGGIAGVTMALRSVSAWLSPTTNQLHVVAAGDRGLLVYYDGSTWNLQLQQTAAPGQPCTVPGPNQQNFINETTSYFRVTQCRGWVSDSLNAVVAQTMMTFSPSGAPQEGRVFTAVGDKTISNKSSFLQSSVIPEANPSYLTWTNPFATVLEAAGNPDLRAMTANDTTTWIVGCRRFAAGQNCAVGTSRMFRMQRTLTDIGQLVDVTPSGFPQNPSAVAFIEDRNANASGKLPSHVWVTTDNVDTGKIFRYEYAGGVIAPVATPEVNNSLGLRTNLGSFSGIAAHDEVLGGNMIFNPTYEDDVNNGSQAPAHWFTSAVTRKNRTDAGEDASAGSPEKRLKLEWDSQALSQHVRVDGFTYPVASAPETPLHNSTKVTKDLQLVDFVSGVPSGNPGFSDLNALLTQLLQTRTRTSLRISGFITIPQTGSYDFRVRHTNGARFFLGTAPVSNAALAQADFTSLPRINSWAAGAMRDSGMAAPITLQAGNGWNGTNAFPFTLEWWNGDPASDPSSATPQLSLEWKTPLSGTFTPIPASSLSHFGNDGTAFAKQIVKQTLLPGQSVRVRAQVKVQMNEFLNQLIGRDPRRPQRGWVGLKTSMINVNEVQNVWSLINQSPSSSGSAAKAPTGWQSLDYVMTNTSNSPTKGVIVECMAEYGTVAWCGDISVELVGGIPGEVRNHVWAVGQAGLLAARHSTNPADGRWALEDTPRISDFLGVAADGPHHAWVVGESDTLIRYTGGNVKGWAWIGGDTADQVDPTGATQSNDAVGWVSFNCANTSVANPSGTCNNGPFNFGVHLNGPALCDAGKCSNDPARSCTTSANCLSEPTDGVLSGQGWMGTTDLNQTVSLGTRENRLVGHCLNEQENGFSTDPQGRAQRCALNSDCVGSSGPCVVDPGVVPFQCSANPTFPTTTTGTCDAVSCAENPSACRPVGWMSFDRNETGDPPTSADDYHCSAGLCSGTQISCTTNADCPLARFDSGTGKIQGWARFLSMKKADGSGGWVHLGSSSLSCPSSTPAPGNPACLTTPIETPGYTLCRDCKVQTNGAGPADDSSTCSLCDAAGAQAPNVQAGDLCSQCGTTTQSCKGICQNAFVAQPLGPLPYCASNDQCGAGDRCVGFGRCSVTSSRACITDGECPTSEKCLNVGKVCPVCQSCQRWSTALDQSNGQAFGWAWSEDFGWFDMSSVRIGNVAWLQTKFGDVYSAKDVGSQSQPEPPGGQYNATYLVLAGGKIINFRSQGQTVPSTPLQPIYQEQAPVIPLAKQDKANILGRLDYSNIIADRIGATAGTPPDGLPDTNPICNAGLCANDRKTICSVDANCPNIQAAQGKYGRVVDITNPSLLDAIKFTSSLNSIDLEGKVYFRKGNFGLSTHRIIVGKQNGSGLFVLDGNLTLGGNITYGPNPTVTLTDDRQLPSFGILVTGDLTIAENVTEIHATIYVLGKVTVLSRQSASLDAQLNVYGAMIAHEFDFRRQYRGSIDSPEAAEVIQYDGRLTANPPPGFQDLSKALPDLRAVTP
jgi:hypothetical protein